MIITHEPVAFKPMSGDKTIFELALIAGDLCRRRLNPIEARSVGIRRFGKGTWAARAVLVPFLERV